MSPCVDVWLAYLSPLPVCFNSAVAEGAPNEAGEGEEVPDTAETNLENGSDLLSFLEEIAVKSDDL